MIPESGRSPGEGNGNPVQYSCLENPMDGGVWPTTVHGLQSRTRLSDFTFTFTLYDSIILLFNLILLTMLIRLLNQTSILGKFIGRGTAFFLRIANAIETF